MYTNICIYIYIYKNMYMSICIYIYIYIHRYPHISIYDYVRVPICTCIYVCIYVCIYMMLTTHIFAMFVCVWLGSHTAGGNAHKSPTRAQIEPK